VGKLHRLKRRIDKSTLKRLGLKETELGELRKDVSKAEARRRALWEYFIRVCVQPDLVEAASQRASKDIAAEEDARFSALLEATAASMAVATSTA
jgi:hypothetical protein